MSERIRLQGWSATPLGPLADWPAPLQTAVSLCLTSKFPTMIQWGWPDPVVLYNDACIPAMGDKHPRALGMRFFDYWPELRPTVEPVLAKVMTSGESAAIENLLTIYNRNGFLEERYFTTSYSPILIESGKPGGAFASGYDVTEAVIGARRLRTLRDLASRSEEVVEAADACRIAADVLGENSYDVPFASIYLVEGTRRTARLAGSTGVQPGLIACPLSIELQIPEMRNTWPLAHAAATNRPLQVNNVLEMFGPLPGGPWNIPPQSALVIPIAPAGSDLVDAFLIAGLSPRQALDAYREFLELIAVAIGQTSMRVRLRKEIAERRHIANSEAELRQLLDLIPAFITVVSPAAEVIYTNRTVRDYTGLSIEEFSSPEFRAKVFPPEETAQIHPELSRRLQGTEPFRFERRARRKDGMFRWFQMEYNPLLDDQGRVVRWYLASTDIDDRVRSEERTRSENVILREQVERDSMYEDIVGSSERLRRVLTQISKVAPSDSTILILGETGTGKELVARAIHKRSSRASRAFIAVNCASIPQSLIASELFGHEKGSFTGATQRRLGRFEAANGGTIFLDEVGDLPQEIQIALLRVLQQREIERVGADRPIPVDVRVVAATHRNLDALVSEGKFRQDLLYRLNVVPIQMPSLRERAADIPLLVEYFIARFGSKAGKRFRTIDKAALKLLQAYDWPGNVRELQNVIERAVILSESDCFTVDETWFRREPPHRPRPTATLSGVILNQEKEIIEAALTESRGRVSGPTGAAAQLGLPPQTLDSKIRRLGIDKYRFKSQPNR